MVTFDPIQDLTITTASIPDGAGRMGTMVDNSTNAYTKIHWWCRLKSGSVAPTADTIVTVYAFRADKHATTEWESDGLGKVDAALTVKPENVIPIGSMVFTATTAKFFYARGVLRNPGPGEWTLGFFNEVGQTLSPLETDGFIHWVGETA